MSIFDKTIELCPVCEQPLVWSFIYPGCEWYCINCKEGYPMFCDSISIEKSNENYKYYEIKQKVYSDIFKAITKDFVPNRCYKNKCKKCEDRTEYHSKHLTEKEILKDKVAKEILKRIKFNKR